MCLSSGCVWKDQSRGRQNDWRGRITPGSHLQEVHMHRNWYACTNVSVHTGALNRQTSTQRCSINPDSIMCNYWPISPCYAVVSLKVISVQPSKKRESAFSSEAWEVCFAACCLHPRVPAYPKILPDIRQQEQVRISKRTKCFGSPRRYVKQTKKKKKKTTPKPLPVKNNTSLLNTAVS